MIENDYLIKSFQTWYRVLRPVLDSAEFNQLGIKLAQEYQSNIVYPLQEDIFKAFQLCKYQDLKVILLAQDPYHNKGAATGLCFANNSSYTKISPSLRNIIREVENEYQDTYPDFNTDLEHWARQGVLLLNTALTVIEGQPESHLTLWKSFTSGVLEIIAKNSPGTIIMCWGKKAQKHITPEIQKNCHVLCAAHPAAEVYKSNAGFFGCNHFNIANELISKANGSDYEIDWLGKVYEIV